MDLMQNESVIDTTSTAPNALIMAIINSSNNLSTNDLNQHHLISTNSFELNTATSLSDDSGIPHTNSSISSSGSSRIGMCKFEFELAESDGEVSQFDSLDNCSDGGMSAENFNTLKKVPLAPIDPPPEFQDSPQTTLLRSQVLQSYAIKLADKLILNAYESYTNLPITNHNTKSSSYHTKKELENINIKSESLNNSTYNIINRNSKEYVNNSAYNIYDEPPLILSNSNSNCNTNSSSKYKFKKILYSPIHHGSNLSTINRPNSRNSLNSRLSSSHNSLSVTTTNKVDDSIFITQAMSHDALLSREIIDFYNVPIDSDIYALPIDFVQEPLVNKNLNKTHRNKLKSSKTNFNNNIKKRRRTTNDSFTSFCPPNCTNDKFLINNQYKLNKSNDKRHSVPENAIEPMHMTLDEVKKYYHSLYSSSSDSNENLNRKIYHNKKLITNNSNNKTLSVISQTTSHNLSTSLIKNNHINSSNHNNNNNNIKLKIKSHNVKKLKEDQQTQTSNRKITTSSTITPSHTKKSSQFTINFKQKFCSIFRFRKSSSSSSSNNTQQSNFTNLNHNHHHNNNQIDYAITRDSDEQQIMNNKKIKFSTRALPPLPNKNNSSSDEYKTNDEQQMNSTIDFATNIEKVKECGWYWGPISSEAAEKILSNEPDGSFIVRDSSDDHYIFSLTFKLSGCIRHVRIEQDQGEFSFGAKALFKSRTITEFIENAVEHSRSGRYLFFLHRRPEHGPLRVQLTNPVSRFRHIQSLQHMCRFVILKAVVRKDLIQTLPLPRRLLDYLSYKNCFSEQVESDSSQSQTYGCEGDETPS